MELARSPLAPATFPALPDIAGLEIATHASAIKYKDRTDLWLARLPEGSSVAGVFTQSLCPGEPVVWCRSILPKGRISAVIVNAGNANAFTGKKGHEGVKLTTDILADALNVPADEIYTASTGVIGEPLPMGAMKAGLKQIATQLGKSTLADGADAIRTTDTFPKGAGATTEIDGKTVHIAGITKGSGMIAPDMATMLGFVFTDVDLPSSVLQDLLSGVTEKSFNSITVDSDTSTSDTVLLAATRQVAVGDITDATDPRLDAFRTALQDVMQDLAWQIVRDGEGATKFVEIEIKGAESDAAAKRIALSVANSPLVKTAIAGEDANWGRIIMAVGKAGEKADRDQLKIWVGDQLVTENGYVRDGYSEEDSTAHMQGQDIYIGVDVGIGGSGTWKAWTCDLTHGYITINGDYRS